MYDVKVNRKYWYSDQACRLCEQAVETIEHVHQGMPDQMSLLRTYPSENIATILSRFEHFELSSAERGTGSRKSTCKS